MKDQEKIESELALESRRIEEHQVYKFNFMSTITFLKVDEKKKLMNKRDSVLKRNKNFLDSNGKLETSVSTLKSHLDTTIYLSNIKFQGC